MIQKWREQNGIFNPRILEQENEEETKKLDFLKNEQNDNNVTTQNKKLESEKRMEQLKIMAKQLKRLTSLCKEREGEQLNEGHPFCAKIKRKT